MKRDTAWFKALGAEIFEKMKELNPSGGIKEYIRMAAELGYKRAKDEETRVYVLEPDDIDRLEVSFEEISDEEFISIAEKQGRVYTLVGFQEAFNLSDIDSEGDAIRII